MEIARLERSRIAEFSGLVRSVYDEFVAPDYSEEGNRTFHSYIDPAEMERRFDAGQWFFACLEEGAIVGALEVRDLNHVALFFVEKRFMGRRIGRALFDSYIEELGARDDKPAFVEVNSSIYARDIYAKLGFGSESGLQERNGIKFYYMRLDLGARYRRTTWDDPAFQALIRKLDAELWGNYPTQQGNYAPKNLVGGDASVVVCFEGDEPVACGCFRPTGEAGIVELKRMYVDGRRRGAGLGKGLLRELESWACESGFRAIVLETGIKQLAAIAMYERSGYERIANYGEYHGNANSLCMRKELPCPRTREGGSRA
jgi:putative acetyltransferase